MKDVFNSDLDVFRHLYIVSALMTFEVRRPVFWQYVEEATTTPS